MRKSVLIATCLCVTGCAYLFPSRSIKEGFDCYDGKLTSIRKVLNINGHFRQTVLTHNNFKLDSFYYDVIFFEDGMYASNIADYNSRKREDTKNDLNQFFKEIVDDSDTEAAKYFYKRSKWGIYSISGDTIKIKSAYISNSLGAINVWEEWYKVLDRNTVIEIYSKLDFLIKSAQRVKHFLH